MASENVAVVEVSKRTALRHLIKAGGRIMSARFFKEDGSERVMTFRREVSTNVKSNTTGEKNNNVKRKRRNGALTVVEMDGSVERPWKSVNLKTLQELKINGTRYVVKG